MGLEGREGGLGVLGTDGGAGTGQQGAVFPGVLGEHRVDGIEGGIPAGQPHRGTEPHGRLTDLVAGEGPQQVRRGLVEGARQLPHPLLGSAPGRPLRSHPGDLPYAHQGRHLTSQRGVVAAVQVQMRHPDQGQQVGCEVGGPCVRRAHELADDGVGGIRAGAMGGGVAHHQRRQRELGVVVGDLRGGAQAVAVEAAHLGEELREVEVAHLPVAADGLAKRPEPAVVAHRREAEGRQLLGEHRGELGGVGAPQPGAHRRAAGRAARGHHQGGIVGILGEVLHQGGGAQGEADVGPVAGRARRALGEGAEHVEVVEGRGHG